ncbi:uncharacterized protein [Henckelia pumila]|uniref:uncharacterized protein n=1 Tax=Henckelia pumila TaxID=405737 RepID=UPI003C6E0EA5
MPLWVEFDWLRQAVLNDPVLQQVIRRVGPANEPMGPYTVVNGNLIHKGRLVLPKGSNLVQKILGECHTTPSGGHSGGLRTLKRVAGNFYWVGMKADVLKMVAECDICQRQKYQATKPSGLLQPLPIPELVWEDVSLDFIVGLPKSRGFDVIMVVVDRLSKYSHFILHKHPFNAKGVAENFIKEIVRLHGVPRQPPVLTNFVLGETKVAAVGLELSDRDEVLRHLKYNLQRAQNSMTKYANGRRKNMKFQVGDLVGSMAYKLQIPKGSKIHHVFHVSLIKWAVGAGHALQEIPRGLDADFIMGFEPHKVLSTRIKRMGTNDKLEVLISWKDKATEEATWEDAKEREAQFPHFTLEDKANLKGEGIVRVLEDHPKPNVKFVYTRRHKNPV